MTAKLRVKGDMRVNNSGLGEEVNAGRELNYLKGKFWH